MPVSEAQKRATAKYRRENTRQMTLTFYPSEHELWEHVASQENKQGYIKQLIRSDMERKQAE